MEKTRLDPQIFDELRSELDRHGAEAAIEHVCRMLRQRQDYHNLFYALLMKKRYELGVTPVPTSPAQRLPQEVHESYEEAIREAANTVGQLFLAAGNIPHAWAYYRMLGETKPVVQALDNYQPQPDEDTEPIVGIAYHEGVHPRKGFDIILERYGLCSAITTLGGQQFPHGNDVRDYCIRRVIRTLYNELQERLRMEIARQEGEAPPANTPVRELIQGRPYLFAEELYHVDISHLSSVIQLAIHLSPCEELHLARELCGYGERLSPSLRFNTEPPFEDLYKDYGVYLAILAGDNVEEGLNHFRRKIEQLDVQEYGTYPVEVLVNLLLRADRTEEALEWAGKYLVDADDRQLTCPGIIELCERTRNYPKLAELARQHENVVHYLAGLLAARQTT